MTPLIAGLLVYNVVASVAMAYLVVRRIRRKPSPPKIVRSKEQQAELDRCLAAIEAAQSVLARPMLSIPAGAREAHEKAERIRHRRELKAERIRHRRELKAKMDKAAFELKSMELFASGGATPYGASVMVDLVQKRRVYEEAREEFLDSLPAWGSDEMDEELLPKRDL